MLSTIAMYLPQFHRVPENDEWWGAGFTEWTAVKRAEKLYEGHNQPRVPLKHYYYNLLEHDTLEWQAELMEKYRVDGMCFYHYWFDGGRRILEKPAENLLKWTDISMPFCFCWANETWSRTWKKLSDSNTWTSTYEPENSKNDNGILLKQTYGREKDWEKHFQYLLPFFKDDRYIKLDGMPVFIILKPGNIFSLWSMRQCFDAMAKEEGFPGVYIIGMEENKLLGLDAACIKQPNYATLSYLQEHGNISRALIKYPYDDIWNRILNHKIIDDKTYLCGMVDFDTTPRMGQQAGSVMENVSPEKFYAYFKQLYLKSLALDNEFIFVNAWNEWGESMYLEPDEENGYGYLEALQRVVTECNDKGCTIQKEQIEDLYETEEEKDIRHKNEVVKILRKHDKLLDDWMYLRDHNVDFSLYFKKYGYQNVAIYGMGKLGVHLLHELDKCGIGVIYGIDRNAVNNRYAIDVYDPGQQLPEADAVIITITDQYAQISEMLGKNMKCPMIAIEEIIQELILDN